MRIQGSGALVAGGASGLGEATARRLRAEGATVTIADVDVDRGEALAAELDGRFVRCDVREEDEVRAAVDAAAEAAGGLRISVCCAGTVIAERTASRRGPHDLEAFARVVGINLVGTFNVLRLAAATMRGNEPLDEGERGVCVNTASIAAFEGQIGQVAYASSKGGIVAMTLPAARDLAPDGIRVVAVAPGVFDTAMVAGMPEDVRAALGASVPFPPRLGRPPEFAQLVCSIVENPMLNGEVVRLDGALRMAPR
jgi:NAD(P)-dependent dehydrogenase (short-subunit alcohol dehydrogenase family)